MSLTGLPLLASVGFAAVVLAAATAAGWRRVGRCRFLGRVAGILLTEATVLLTVGLAVNRSQQFYPSWGALVHRSSPIREAPDRPGRLDRWLRARLGGHGDQPIAVTWRPSNWPTWHLASPPTVVVPAGYLLHPSWRYPVVLVATGQHDGWSDADEVSAAQWARSVAGPVILVFAHVRPSATPGLLATALPQSLIVDLRVTAHGWVIVAPVAEAALAHQAVLTQPGRFPALALVPAASARPLLQPAQQAVASARDAAARPAPAHGDRSPLVGLPVGETVAVIAPGSAAALSGLGRVSVIASPVTTLRTALLWASQQTPPPLPAAAPLIPPAPARSHTRLPGHVHPSAPPSSGPSER